MGTEFELKYRADQAQLEAIRESAGGAFERIDMETTYYDTVDSRLSAQKWTLRRRMENGVAVCTLKTPGDDGSRGEWECRCADVREAIEMLCKLGAPEELRAIVADGIIPVCGARFTRLARSLQLPGAEAELALDSGVLLGGGKEQIFAEVEVEQKSGSREAVCAYARALTQSHGLEPEKRSKFRRAWALSQD